jgi:hypothetical protein
MKKFFVDENNIVHMEDDRGISFCGKVLTHMRYIGFSVQENEASNMCDDCKVENGE